MVLVTLHSNLELVAYFLVDRKWNYYIPNWDVGTQYIAPIRDILNMLDEQAIWHQTQKLLTPPQQQKGKTKTSDAFLKSPLFSQDRSTVTSESICLRLMATLTG